MGTLKTYYHLTKPGIIYGNLLSAAAGFFLAAHGKFDVWLLLALLAGTGLVIGSACVFNNVIDRDIDKKMARTKKRALVSGEVSALAALSFASVLAVAGFSLLVAFTNSETVLTGAVGMVSYVIVYAIAKRRSWLGTIVGSVPGATPLVAGYVAVTNQFDAGALLLFALMAVWQLPHFYAIAIFRRKEYAAAGVPVLPVAKSVKTAQAHIAACIVLYLMVLVLLKIFGYTGYVFTAGMLALGLLWLRVAVQGLSAKDSEQAARKVFGFSLLVLLGFAGLALVANWLP